MTVEEQRRARLYDAARRVLGDEEAATLMDELGRWHDAATRNDVAALEVRTREGFAELRSEMADLRAELRTEMAELGSDLRTEMAELGSDLRTEMAGLRAEMHSLLRRQTMWIVAIVVPTMLTGVGLTAAVTGG